MLHKLHSHEVDLPSLAAALTAGGFVAKWQNLAAGDVRGVALLVNGVRVFPFIRLYYPELLATSTAAIASEVLISAFIRPAQRIAPIVLKFLDGLATENEFLAPFLAIEQTISRTARYHLTIKYDTIEVLEDGRFVGYLKAMHHTYRYRVTMKKRTDSDTVRSNYARDCISGWKEGLALARLGRGGAESTR